MILPPVEIQDRNAIMAKAILRVKLRQCGTVSSAFKKQYYNDPEAFAHDCIRWREGEQLAPYQAECLTALVEKKRIAVRGPHGLGKSCFAAIATHWFALTRDGEDWKIPVTASAWRQLTKYLWPEIHKWAGRLDWTKIGRNPYDERQELMTLNLRLATGEAFALASTNAAWIEGAHAEHLLYIFDEAKVIPGATFDAAEGAFSTSDQGEALAIAMSTPGEPNGRFHDICSRKPGYLDWWTRHITQEEAIAAKRMSLKWVEDRKLQWGEESAIYQNRALGEFASSEGDGVIPLAWVEAANLRWMDWKDNNKVETIDSVGVDVARSGADKTVLALRSGNIITDLRHYSKADTMETTGRVQAILEKYKARAIVDVIGIGAGVVDRLREQGYDVDAFNASESTQEKDRSGELGFLNLRSAAWWQLRELLDPANGEDIALPADDLLIGDLTAPHWRVVSGGKIQIESKEDIGKRLGRSTDYGDAVAFAFWGQRFIAPASASVERKSPFERERRTLFR